MAAKSDGSRNENSGNFEKFLDPEVHIPVSSVSKLSPYRRKCLVSLSESSGSKWSLNCLLRAAQIARWESSKTCSDTKVSFAEYGYGTISVVVISLLGLLGVVFFPLVNRKIYNYTLQGFIALGVGTLCGDAMLHLLPEVWFESTVWAKNRMTKQRTHPIFQALNVRDDADNADLEKKEEKEHLVLWRCVACLAALYAFFLWEISLHYFIRYRAAKGKDRQHLEEDNDDHSHIPDQAVFAKARAANEKSEMEMAHNCSETSSGQVHAHVHQPETLLGKSREVRAVPKHV